MPFGPTTIDAILGLILLELVLISAWLWWQGQQRLVPAVFCFLTSGALVMAALRVSLSEVESEPLIPLLIALSFPAHIAALWLAWRNTPKS